MPKLNRSNLEIFTAIQKKLVQQLKTNPLIHGRVKRMQSIREVGELTALTWVLEIDRGAGTVQIGKKGGLCDLQRDTPILCFKVSGLPKRNLL